MRFFRNIQNKLRQHQGVTLPEMLIAVAIIVVLLALAAPPLGATAKGLKMTEMDDYARSIYVEVQNRLTSMKASGELKEFQQLLASDSYRASHNLGELDRCPQDYDAETDDLWKNLYFLSSAVEGDKEALAYVVGPGYVGAALTGCYTIELDPLNGNVYSVFYAEEDFYYLYHVYTDLGISAAARTRENRTPYRLGYYNGALDTETVISLDLEQQLEVINREELYLCLTYRINTIQESLNKLHIRITVSDQHGGTYTIDKTGAELILSGDTGSVDVLLDSMLPGFDFATITGLTPGDNLTIKVTCDYRNSIYAYASTTDVGSGESGQAVSSLFAQREGENIQVAYVRHLHNLRESIFSGYTETTPLAVTQTAAMDFADNTAFAWGLNGFGQPVYDTSAGNPLSSFTPIANSHLDGGSYDGCYRELRNFNIVGSAAGSGLFASLTDTDLANIRLIDTRVSGGGASGTLAAVMNGGSVVDCGAHLTITDSAGERYSGQAAASGSGFENRMQQREAIYTVSGGATSGGLVGQASGVTFREAYAALAVSGSGASGGLIGAADDGCALANCYASGDVTATTNVGGLVGSANGAISLTDCYSTSDITAASQAGGILGSAAAATLNGCRYYGQLLNEAGSAVPTASGGIVGDGSGAACTNCQYLFQVGYNQDDLNELAGAAARQRYTSLQHPAGSTSVSSYPYDWELGGAFPFAAVCDEHWGDWPVRFTLKAALVYYEKYEDGSFGYYCKTGLTNDESAESGNYWLLDTLRDEGYCIEDGYALATVYNLKQFSYEINSAVKVTLNKSATAGSSSFVEIARPSDVEFWYVENHTIGSDYMTMSYLYVYQLPFALQDPSRDIQAKFFDELKLTAGYMEGQVVGTDNPVLSGFTFYYNGHFAKNAINPDPEYPAATKVWPDPEEISVRSARQLNCLGRYFFYWDPSYWRSASGAAYEQVTYNQELNISFSAYVKTYCGVTYDLMDTDSANPYRNTPIGRSKMATENVNNLTIKPGNFRNIFDGHSHLIEDFRIGTSWYQYLGLFGEVEGPYRKKSTDNKVATIRNIIMVTDPTDSESYGYIRNTWVGTNRPGAGALVGKLHRSKSTGVAYTEALISNCCVSGYEVTWSGTDSMTYNAAVGGLVGFNLATIENSSAVGNLVKITYTRTGSPGNGALGVGGLVGSNMNTIRNCYAGGTLCLSTNNATMAARSTIGGICGAAIQTFSDVTSPYPTVTVSDCYSYCTVDAANTNAAVRFYGVTSGIFGGRNNNAKDDTREAMRGATTVTNCYYLNDVLDDTVNLTPAAAGYAEDGTVVQVRGTNNANYNVQVTAVDYISFKALRGAEVTVTAANSHPWSQRLSEDDPIDYPYSGGAYGYPFAGKVRLTDEAGAYTDYIHIGDWPAPPAGQVVYWESYDSGASYGLYYYDVHGELQNTLDIANAHTIDNAGYGFLLNEGADFADVALSVDGANALGDTYTYYTVTGLGRIYPLNPAATEALAATATGSPLQVAANSRTTTVYLNSGFAAALSLSAETDWGSAEQPLQVRSQHQLYQVGRYEASGLYYSQTHNIIITAAPAQTRSLPQGCFFDGNNSGLTADGNTISGLRQPLFNYNNGTVQNLLLAATAISGSGNLAAVAVSNMAPGIVTNCLLSGGTVTSVDQGAAGLVHSNTGTVSSCRAEALTVSAAASAALLVHTNSASLSSCLVTNSAVTAGGNAAGLALTSGAEASVSDCLVTDSQITSTAASAAGFIWSCGHSLTGSASNGAVSGLTVQASQNAAGLLGESASVSGCTVNNCFITAANGAAAGLTLTAGGVTSACTVTASSVTATLGDAAGLLDITSAAASVTGCGVADTTVTAGANGAGLLRSAAAPVSDSLVTNTSVDATGVAVGLIHTAAASVSGCTVSNGSRVSAATDGAGLIALATQGVDDCRVDGVSVTAANGNAAGLILTAQGQVSASSVGNNSTVSGGAAAAGLILTADGPVNGGCQVTGSAISGGQGAAGFIRSATQPVSGNCQVSAITVTAPAGDAAGFIGQTVATVSDCAVHASSVTAAAGAAAGFAGSATAALTNCTVGDSQLSGYTDAAGLLLTADGAVNSCTVSGGSVIAASGSAAGLLLRGNGSRSQDNVSDVTIQGATAVGLLIESDQPLSGCTVSGGSVTATNGQAAGLLLLNHSSLTGCAITAPVGGTLYISATGGNAAGFILTNDTADALSGCNISSLAVSAATGNAAGFIYANTRGAVSDCIAADLTVTASGDAAGFIHTNASAISGCQLRDTNVASTVSGGAAGFIHTNSAGQLSQNCQVSGGAIAAVGGGAAGFILDNSAPLLNCSLLATAAAPVAVSSVNSNAAAFILTNSAAVDDCYARSEGAYDSLSVNGYQATGFIHTNSGSLSGCYAAGLVTGAASATGLLHDNSAAVSGCYADCRVTAPTAAAFVLTSTGQVMESFAAGTVTASTAAYGFQQSGSAENCYTVAELLGSGTQSGFGGSASGCYWAQAPAVVTDGYAGFNLNASDSSGAESKSLVQMAGLSLGGSGWANAFTYPYANSGGYPYPLNGLDYYGDWPPLNPAAPETFVGRLGLLYQRSGSYSNTYLNVATRTAATASLSGLPDSLLADAFYVVFTNDLYPGYADWTVTWDNSDFSLGNTPLTGTGCTCYAVSYTDNGSWLGNITSCSFTFTSNVDPDLSYTISLSGWRILGSSWNWSLNTSVTLL